MIKKMIFPMIKKYWKLLLSTLIVTALGSAMMIGLSSSHKSLKNTLDSYVSEYNYPDAEIVTEVANVDKINSLKEIDGIIEVNTRLGLDTVMISPEGKYLSTRIFSYNDDDFQKMHIWSSSENNDINNVLMDYNFAKDNNINAGDKVQLKIGDEYREYVVTKIISLPETLATQITDKSWGANSDFGFIYASTELLKNETIKEKKEATEEVDEKSDELNAKVESAEKQHSQYQKQIDDSEIKLKNEAKKLKETKKELETKIEQLNNTKTELLNAEAELNKKKEEANETKKLLSDVISKLEEVESKLTEAKASLDKIDASLEKINLEYKKYTSNEIKEYIEIAKALPENTSISKAYQVGDKLKEFFDLLDKYEIPFDLGGTIQNVAKRLDKLTDSIVEDYNYINKDKTIQLVEDVKNNKDGIKETEEYKYLIKIIRKYNKFANINDIEKAYNTSKGRIEKLSTYVENNRIFVSASFINKIGNDKTLPQLINEANQYRDLPDTLASLTGKEKITTAGELLKAYNQLENTTKDTINKLEDNRKNITNLLSSQGINEKDLNSILLQTEEQLKDTKDNLKNIDDNIPKIEDGLIEIENNLKQIDDTISSINNNISSSEEQLKQAEKELNSKKKKLNSTWINTKKQFSNAREELQKAYDEIENKDGYEEFFNQILLKFDKDKNAELLLAQAINSLDGVNVKSSYIYDNSAVKNRIEANLDPIETMSIFMPIVFFTIILVVVFLFMSLIVKQCRREIGILRALGIENNQIRLLFCTINLIVLILSIILGIIIGIYLMKYVGNYYKDFFPLPSFDYSINWKMFWISIILTILIGQIATIVSSRSIEKVQPTEAMSRPTPSNEKIPYILKMITKKAKPFTKYSITTLLRNKLKFILSVICIAASVMMIFSALSFITSKNYILNQLYNERINYGAQVFLKDYPDEQLINELNEIEGISDIEIVDYYDIKITANDKEESVLINSLDINTNLIGIFDGKGNKLSIPEEGIILEEHTANKLGVKKGDKIYINNNPIEIVDISEQSINRIQYISRKQAEAIGKGDFETIILNISQDKEQKLLSTLSEKDTYLYTVFTRLSYESNEKIFATYDMGAWIIIGFAIVIGLVIVVNTTLTNLLEQKKKLCMLRVLGFQHSEVSKHWFAQSILQFICACIVGFPMGIIIAKIALEKLSTESRQYVYANGLKEYIITILLVFAYMLVSHIISMRTFKHWNITETVKEKE